MEEKEIMEEENEPSEKKPTEGNFMKIILLLAMVFVVMYMVFGKGKNDDACIVVSQSPFGQSQKQVWIDLENKLQAKGIAGFDLEVPEELEQTYTNVSYRAFSYQISEVTFHDDNGEDVIRIDKAKFCGKDILTTDDNSYTNIQKVTIDGKDVRELTIKSLRSQIGLVQQDVYLFCGSIRDNIAYGKPGASMEEIIAAAKRANIHDFIMELPDGYETFVGERGTRLSGGQKQRISIARVFLKNPSILILDEATSALDNESERFIQKSLDELAKDRTTITIAHRLSTVRNADEILVVADTGIAERGTHEELLEKGGIYAHYYEMS